MALKAKTAPKTANLQAGTGVTWQPAILTWYDPALGGTNSASGKADPNSKTASGEPYDASKATCAAPPAYAFGTLLTFKYGKNQVTCKVNDRGGAIQGNHFDLSRAAAQSLGIINAGRVAGSFMIGGSPGSPVASAANNQTGGGGNQQQIGSVLDLLTAPVDALGGWFASIIFNMLKDAGEAIANDLIRPAWHWNQRAAMKYQTDMFADKSGKQLLWTAAFWGGGYWLLFTDPSAKNLKPAPVRNSRLARHARFAQSLPARHSLIKPKHVKERTPKKPKPVTSRAVVSQTGTMRTTRTQTVKVTGDNARTDFGSETANGTESRERIERAGSLPTETKNTTRNKPTVPHPEHRTGSRSLQDRKRNPPGGTNEGERGGR